MDRDSIARLREDPAPLARFDVPGAGSHLLRCAYPKQQDIRVGDAEFFATLRSRNPDSFFDRFVPPPADVLDWVASSYDPDLSQLNCIISDDSGTRLGFVGLTGMVDRRPTAEFGRVMRVADAPPGLMQAAMAALFGCARRALGLQRLCLKVFADNDRAIRFYERMAFVHTGSHWRILEGAGPHGKWICGAGPGSREVLEMELNLADGR